MTEEHKKKIGEGNKGKIVSQETKEKLRNRDCYLYGEKHYLYGWGHPNPRVHSFSWLAVCHFDETLRVLLGLIGLEN